VDRQIAERDVIGNRQRGHQPQLLWDGDAAGRDCVVGACEVPHNATHDDLPAIRPVDAGENANEGRFAGAVLAHNRVNFAGPNVKIDPVERERGAELLADALQARGRRY
jgi:hypothetical protein